MDQLERIAKKEDAREGRCAGVLTALMTTARVGLSCKGGDVGGLGCDLDATVFLWPLPCFSACDGRGTASGLDLAALALALVLVLGFVVSLGIVRESDGRLDGSGHCFKDG